MAKVKFLKKSKSKSKSIVAQPVMIVKPKRQKGSINQKIGNSMPFPIKKFVTLTASNNTRLTLAGAGAMEYITLRMNGPYDPETIPGGVTPEWYNTFLGADVSTKPYRAYRVIASRIKVQFVSEGAANTSLLECAVHLREAVELPLVGSDDFYSADHTVHTILGSGYSGNGIKTLKTGLTKAGYEKFFGIKDIYDDDDTASLYNTLPNKQIYADIMVQPFLASSATVNIRWTIEYDCQLFDLNQYT